MLKESRTSNNNNNNKRISRAPTYHTDSSANRVWGYPPLTLFAHHTYGPWVRSVESRSGHVYLIRYMHCKVHSHFLQKPRSRSCTTSSELNYLLKIVLLLLLFFSFFFFFFPSFFIVSETDHMLLCFSVFFSFYYNVFTLAQRVPFYK